ncbi:Cytochrome c oxidase assembly protein cox15 [Rhizina undulata]
MSSALFGLRMGAGSSIYRQIIFKNRAVVQTPRTYPTFSKSSTSTPSLLRRPHLLRSFSFTSRAPTTTIPITASPLGLLADGISLHQQQVAEAAAIAKEKSRWFKDTSDKVVGYWLLGSAGLVFGIVVLGGLTRLTESGLSITEWKPITGTLPPLTLEDWEENFRKYRDSPEYRILNPNMTLEEYKFIYFMEWGHRLWGRFIGLSFVLPAIYFVARRKVSARVAARLFGIAGMIGFQGFLGWWMVKSGLQDDLFEKPGSHPRVSQYRLTAHLGAAFAVYSAILWSGLDILRENRLLKSPSAALAEFRILANPNLRLFRGAVGVVTALVFVTAMSGGLVAGLDAGLIYNEFPYMGTGFIPPRSEMWSTFYSHLPDQSDLWWRNMLENPITVQFDHRCMAMTTFTTIVALFLYSRFNPRVAVALTKSAKKGTMGVLHLAILQVALGISTLIYLVPTHLAATHQAGSLALLTGSIILGSRVWLPKTAARIAAKRIEAAAAKVVKSSA